MGKEREPLVGLRHIREQTYIREQTHIRGKGRKPLVGSGQVHLHNSEDGADDTGPDHRRKALAPRETGEKIDRPHNNERGRKPVLRTSTPCCFVLMFVKTEPDVLDL